MSYAYKTKGDNEVFLEIESQRQNERKSFIFLSETEHLPSISDSDATNGSIEKKPIQSSKVIINPKPIENVLKECLNQICLPAKDCDWTTRYNLTVYIHYLVVEHGGLYNYYTTVLSILQDIIRFYAL